MSVANLSVRDELGGSNFPVLTWKCGEKVHAIGAEVKLYSQASICSERSNSMIMDEFIRDSFNIYSSESENASLHHTSGKFVRCE